MAIYLEPSTTAGSPDAGNNFRLTIFFIILVKEGCKPVTIIVIPFMCLGGVSGSFFTAENSFGNVDFNYVVTRQRFGNMDKNRRRRPFFEFVPEAGQGLQFLSIGSSVSSLGVVHWC